MKKYLLPEKGNFYKANLHSHSTVSDGRKTPEELKRLYREAGYSILAYTDHHVQVAHGELTDESFLPLIGYELSVNEYPKDPFRGGVCHICFIALDPAHILQESHYPNQYEKKNEGALHYDQSRSPIDRTYTPEAISAIMKQGREDGYFVSYNHPTWSRESYPQYCNYHGMHALEIMNHSCMTDGYNEINERVYDEMLRAGERVYCVASDDNHNAYSRGSRRWDSFGAFTVIKAECLEYGAVAEALLAGNFYASQAPEIYELWFEDGRLHISCSPADTVRLTCGKKRTQVCYAENGILLTQADFEISPDDRYVRITVLDENGKAAFTNAYFTDELFS